MKRALPCLAVAAVFGGFGCGGATTAFNRTGPTIAAQPDGCDFAVVTSAPSDPYTVLGTIDIQYTSQMDWIYEEPAFKKKVAPLVCQTGGDTAIAHTNDNGLYVKATVLTTKPLPKAPEESSPPPETAAAAVDSVASPEPAAPPPAPEKSAEAKPDKKEESAKKDEADKEAVSGKKGGKKGARAKKDDDIRGKDGKIDIDKLL